MNNCLAELFRIVDFVDLVDAKKKLKICDRQAVHPDGHIGPMTPNMVAVQVSMSESSLDYIVKTGRSLKKELINFRVERGEIGSGNLFSAISDLGVIFNTKDGRMQLLTGNYQLVDNILIAGPSPILDPAEKKLYSAVKDYLKKNATLVGRFLFCPTTFNYDTDSLDFSGLEKLLDEKNYSLMPERSGLVRSKNIKIPVAGLDHKVVLNYGIRIEDNRLVIYAKYVAIGLKGSDNRRDKLDIVMRLNEFGKPCDLVHFEARNYAATEIERSNRDMLHANVDEDVGLIADANFLNQMRLDVGQAGVEYKTDIKNHIVFGNVLYGSEAQDYRYDYVRIKNLYINYAMLVEKPFIIGGAGLQTAMDHIHANSELLNKIHRNISRQKNKKL